MRRAITLARTGVAFKVLLGPEVPLAKQKAAFKKRVASAKFDGADEIEIWTSDSRIKRATNKDLKSDPKAPKTPPQQPEAPAATAGNSGGGSSVQSEAAPQPPAGAPSGMAATVIAQTTTQKTP